ncbi:hypothetical protein QUA81_28810, partial [Microcoleus sp. F6_B4]
RRLFSLVSEFTSRDFCQLNLDAFTLDGVLSIYYLREEEYEKVDRSELLPELDIALLVRHVTYFDQYDAVTEFIKALREEFKSTKIKSN